MNNQNISFVILSWKRVKGTDYLVDWARNEPLIDEIIIWNNNTNAKVCSYLNDTYGHDCRIINSDENLMCYGRWLGVCSAKNDTVYVQDDDWIPGDLNHLLNLFDTSNCDIVTYTAPTHSEQTDRSKFVGFGGIVNRTHISTPIIKYIARYGKDALMCRECDLLVTNMCSYEKHTTHMKSINIDVMTDAMHVNSKHVL